ILLLFVLLTTRYHSVLCSLPTRRSSDLDQGTGFIEDSIQNASDPPSYSRTFVNPTQSQKTFLMKLSALTSEGCVVESEPVEIVRSEEHTSNSSHVKISYAVFCLIKKIYY